MRRLDLPSTVMGAGAASLLILLASMGPPQGNRRPQEVRVEKFDAVAGPAESACKKLEEQLKGVIKEGWSPLSEMFIVKTEGAEQYVISSDPIVTTAGPVAFVR